MGLIGKISKGVFRTGAQVMTDYHAVLSSALPTKQKGRLLIALTKMTVLQYVISKVVPVTKVSFLSFRVETFNFYNLFFLFREIFVRGAYYVDTPRTPQHILDCGANIGIATLFYKWMWPDASIECFEPDANTFELLKKNIEGNKLSKVQLHKAAVSDHDGQIELFSEDANRGCLKMSTVKERVSESASSYKVQAIDLAEHINKGPSDAIDILKMDIEGGEYIVLSHMEKMKSIKRVDRMVIEYHHNIAGQHHSFADFLAILDRAGRQYVVDAEVLPYAGAYHIGQDIQLKVGN